MWHVDGENHHNNLGKHIHQATHDTTIEGYLIPSSQRKRRDKEDEISS
jgi:hypothetical protein